jgi:hypothetical protein
MKKLVQVAVGVALMLGIAPLTFGTPFNHWMVFVPILLAGMYGTAVVQHYLAHRAKR